MNTSTSVDSAQPGSPETAESLASATTGNRPTFAVVGIGASAGGIGALTSFFQHMPAETGIAFVVIVHLSPRHESNLDNILAKVTAMPVRAVQGKVGIQPNHIYLISPALQLSMYDHMLQAEPLERPMGRQVAIDVFFRTLAEAHRERAVCVVLSGTGSDGTVGLARIKERGGVTLAQTPDDAEYADMPKSAIATGSVDFVLPAAQMATKIVELWANMQRIALPELPDLDLAVQHLPPGAEEQAETALTEAMVLLRLRTGHDFRRYKRSTVLRRIERRMQVRGVPTLPEYFELLKVHVDETQALLQDLLISVTNFFRDPEAFEALERELSTVTFTPVDGRLKMRAWVAACATGEEAYTVAMLLSEKASVQRIEPTLQVFASDIDQRAIALARSGVYPPAIASDVTPARIERFFDREQGQLRVRKELREKVLFATHNLLRDPPFSSLDLVCCRNLLIYLDREVQAQVLEIFHFALRPGGLLFLGSSETADAAGELFLAVDKKHRVYRANAALRSARVIGSTALDERLRTVDNPSKPTAAQSALADMHARFRETQAPPSVLIDEAYNILHSTPRVETFLRFAPGQPSRNLLDVVRPELRLELRTALLHARDSHENVEARSVRVEGDRGPAWISITVKPVQESNGAFMLVLFDQVEASLLLNVVEGLPKDPVLTLLEEELQRTREQLHGSIGRSATSTEELRASNEELQAINEELRSATEELETSKEELQSVNEELITVNHELKVKINEAGQSNDDLKNLIASTDIATVFVDRQMTIKRFTPRASQLFNLIAADVGRSLLDITHRLDYEQLGADAARAFGALQVVEREVAGQDGKTYLARVLPYRTNENVIDGAVLTFVDITAVRVAEERLRLGEANLRTVVESTQDYAIVTTDLGGIVTSWNAGAQRIFGFEEANIVGRSISLIFTPEDRSAGVPEEERRRARDEGRAEDERWHLRQDGTIFFCSGILTPLYEKGALIGYAKIARDKTENKRTEEQLASSLVQEKQARADIQHAVALKDEFLAVMSHELKHPLNLIHVNAELLARLPEVRSVPAVTRAAEVIRRTVLNQAKIIDDLLDLSRVSTGKLALARVPVQWAGIVKHVLDAIASDAESQNLTLCSDLDPAASEIVADPVRIEQIVWNLLSNALKFTPPGGTVTVRLWVDGPDGRLDVTDTGQGFDAAFQPYLFDMFRQADQVTTRAQGGMGIGLALVKHLVEDHGGRVEAHSDGIGHGARFSVWLPLSSSPPEPRASQVSLPALSGLRILLVDDSESALEAFGSLLELEGAAVTAVSNGNDALSAAASADFDLILSDVAMPGMDGYQFIAALRRSARNAQAPAIALTGFGRPQDAQRALSTGFDAHIGKPVMIDQLFAAIKRLPKARPNPPTV